MNGRGDLGDLSDFTISSVNECDASDDGDCRTNDGTLTPRGDHVNVAVMKIELSQKTLELEKYKKNFRDREEELQERIDSLVTQRDGIQRQLEHEVRINQEQMVKRAQYIQDQLDRAKHHQQYLESINSKLVQGTINLKDVLSQNLIIDVLVYDELKARPEFDLSVHELIQIKMFETLQPLTKEIINLKYENSELNREREENKNEIDYLRTNLNEEEDNYRSLQEEFKKALLDLSNTKDKVQVGNYKIENFDKIQKTNDNLEDKYSFLKSEFDKLKIYFATVEHERDELIKSSGDLNQSYRLISLDKEYLTKQVNELSCRANNAEDRLQCAWRQLEETKVSREQLYDKYVLSRDEFRTQYEHKLREELDSLRLKTEHEMEKIKISTRELYDRELKSLTEQKDISVAERDIAVRSLKEMEDKIEKTKLEYSMYMSSSENKISELLNGLKMKSFECERTNILYDECCNKLKLASLDCEKFQAKFDMITKEYYQLECRTSKNINELEMKLENASKKLKSYEKLEEELDLAVMHAAESKDNRPVLMWPNGYDSGAQLPTQAGRRMQQSIELARKLLHLERMLKERNETVESQAKEIETLQHDLEMVNSILSEAKQPYTYLIESLRKHVTEINALKLIQKDLVIQLNKIRKEKAQICEEKNRMTIDFEHLLSQKDELLKLKKVFEAIRDQQPKYDELTVTKLPANIPGDTRKVEPLPKLRLQDYSISRS